MSSGNSFNLYVRTIPFEDVAQLILSVCNRKHPLKLSCIQLLSLEVPEGMERNEFNLQTNFCLLVCCTYWGL